MACRILATPHFPRLDERTGLVPFRGAGAQDLVAIRRLVEVTERTNLSVHRNAFWCRGNPEPAEIDWRQIPEETRACLRNRTLFDRATVLPRRHGIPLEAGEMFHVTIIEGAAVIEIGTQITGYLPDDLSAHERLAREADLEAYLAHLSAARTQPEIAA